MLNVVLRIPWQQDIVNYHGNIINYPGGVIVDYPCNIVDYPGNIILAEQARHLFTPLCVLPHVIFSIQTAPFGLHLDEKGASPSD